MASSTIPSLRLFTRDGKSLLYPRDILRLKFELVDNYLSDNANADSIQLNLTYDDLGEILRFVDTLVLPSTPQQWVSVLTSADYVILTRNFHDYLHTAGIYYLQSRGDYVYIGSTLTDLANKITNPSYMSAREAEETKCVLDWIQCSVCSDYVRRGNCDGCVKLARDYINFHWQHNDIWGRVPQWVRNLKTGHQHSSGESGRDR